MGYESSSDEVIPPAFRDDPYPYYRALRENDPVNFDESRGTWLLSRHKDVSAALHDEVHFTAEQSIPTSMLISDPPKHARLRSLVSKAFTPKAVSALEPRIVEIVDDLLDRAAARGEMEAIEDFAYLVPITVIAEMLGVESEKREFFRDATQKIALSLGYTGDPETSRRANEGRIQIRSYFEELIAKRRAEPRDDLVSALIGAEDRGQMLGQTELMAMLILLLIGGHETTVNLIGNGMFAVLRHPDQQELLRTDESVAKTAVEELLRYDSPVLYTGRMVKQEIDIEGKRIPAGAKVRMLLASANRDPEMFSDPDDLVLRRTPCQHLSFGTGIHVCLGAPLARLEGAIALGAVFRRFPNIRLATEAIEWRPAPVLRGIEKLPVLL